jgi:flagellar protein FlgJ
MESFLNNNALANATTNAHQLSSVSNSPSVFSDINSLNGIREQATTDSRAAIKQAAKEFEAFFMNMMLKSMRKANEVIGDDSMFSSPQEKMFIGMLDEQMSVELSQKGNLGIADLMIRNLLGENYQQPPKSVYNPITKILNSPSTDKVSGKLKESISQPVASNNTTRPKEISSFVEGEGINLASQAMPLEPSKQSLFKSATEFVESLAPMAKKLASSLGIDPRVLLAQSALETGWGKYVMHDKTGLSSNNLFGIKDGNNWSGNKVEIETLEVENNELVKKKDEFRMYESIEASFTDYMNFLKSNPRYQNALQSVGNVAEYLENLQSAGYATDPNYASKILRIFKQDIIQNSNAVLD